MTPEASLMLSQSHRPTHPLSWHNWLHHQTTWTWVCRASTAALLPAGLGFPPGKGGSANWDRSESSLGRSGACFQIVSPVPGPGYCTQQHLHYFQVPCGWLLLQELCRYQLRLSDVPGGAGHCGFFSLWRKPEMKTAVLLAKNRRIKKEEWGEKQRKHQDVSKSWQWLSK